MNEWWRVGAHVAAGLVLGAPAAGVARRVLGGFVLATIATTAVARTTNKATGRRHPVAQAVIRFAVVGAASVLALSQLGIDTTILNIVAGAVAFGIAAAVAGIASVGGRDSARSVAAGRSIGPHPEIGDRIRLGEVDGELEQITATHLIVRSEHGARADQSVRRHRQHAPRHHVVRRSDSCGRNRATRGGLDRDVSAGIRESGNRSIT